MSFIERHGLWSDEQRRAATEVMRRIETEGIELVRLSFPDLHGILRGKALLTAAMPSALADGCAVTSTLLLKDTSHRTVVPVFSPGAGMGLTRLQGASDIIMVPDPTTFRVLPWLQSTGWMLCDVYFADGTPVSYLDATPVTSDAGAAGRATDTASSPVWRSSSTSRACWIRGSALEDSGQPGTVPEVELIHQGYNHLTELRLDRIEPITDILRRQSLALGLDLGSVELEYGPSQVEFVFRPAQGMKSADDMILFRSAVKQICRRHGYHATFMCRPSFPNAMSSGWHLHQSLADAQGRNLFAPDEPGELLSPSGASLPRGSVGGRCGGRCIHDSHDQRVQAVSRQLAGARPHRVGQ